MIPCITGEKEGGIEHRYSHHCGKVSRTGQERGPLGRFRILGLMLLVITPFITSHYILNVCLYYKMTWLQEVENWFLAASYVKYITHPRFSEPLTGLIVTRF